jgi:predicted PurR-regulated permease PerM
MPQGRRTRLVFLAVIALIAIGFALYFTRPVAVLFAVAAFLAVLLQPVVRWLDRYLPGWLSLAVTCLGIAVALTGVGLALFVQVRSILEKTPEYAARFQTMLQGALDWVRSLGFEITWQDIGTSDAVTSALGYATEGLQSIFSVATQALLVLIMVIFMLIEGHAFRDKMARIFEPTGGARVDASLSSATRKIQRYVVTKTLVSLVTGVITSLVTAALGVDFAFVWGAIAFQLNFIPYLGSIVAVFPPALVALVQFDTPEVAVITLLSLGAIQFTIGSIIEPGILGRSLALSPLMVFMSMMFWGFFWGLLGVVLSVPLTAVIKIICDHVDTLKPIAVFLGDGSDDHPPAPARAAP